jgi:hypothetical protein
LGGELFGLDLFDVVKVTGLPIALLDKLAWLPGEDEEFFSPGDFRGWPLRVWPTMKRPFIRLGEKILAFDVFVLFDNFYRVLQRVVFRLAQIMADMNQRQKALSRHCRSDIWSASYLAPALSGRYSLGRNLAVERPSGMNGYIFTTITCSLSK